MGNKAKHGFEVAELALGERTLVIYRRAAEVKPVAALAIKGEGGRLDRAAIYQLAAGVETEMHRRGCLGVVVVGDARVYGGAPALWIERPLRWEEQGKNDLECEQDCALLREVARQIGAVVR